MSNTTKSDFAARRLFLIEFYTFEKGTHGYDINFAWVFAPTSGDAIDKLKQTQGARLDDIITYGEQAEITKLAGEFRCNTPEANLFILEASGAIKRVRDEAAREKRRNYSIALKRALSVADGMPVGC